MPDIRIMPTTFLSDNQTIVGDFVLPDGDGPFPGICKFHGLPGGPDQVRGIASELARHGFAVLTFDFRGFRRSEGLFSLKGMIIDAINALDHLIETDLVRRDWLGVYGASFGGAVAVCTAVRDDRVKAVCIRAPVYDTLHFAQMPFFHSLPDEVYLDMAQAFKGVDDVSIRERMLEQLVKDADYINPRDELVEIAPRSLFITTGGRDEVIDSAGVRNLFERAREPKEFLLIEDADHQLTDATSREQTHRAVIEWFLKQIPL
ncbi:MAG: alpha/beta hydrolase [Candidatus Thorarchaeota archaeon]